MKAITFIFSSLVAVAIVVVAAGWYPVALVRNTPIFFSTWKKAADAAMHFTNAQARTYGGEPIDFSAAKNRELLTEVKKGSLAFLIEDLILKQAGKDIIFGFEEFSRERMREALGSAPDSSDAAKLVYDLGEDDFKKLVLLPQARRDIAKEALAEKSMDFEGWFAEEKKKAKVKLFFVPFSWDGESVH